MFENKYFDGKKYHLQRGRWRRVTRPQIYLSRDVWNFYNPKDKVLREEDIHHINSDPSDDRIENLEKITHGKHRSLHQTGVDHSGKNNPMYGTHRTGEDNPNWKGGKVILICKQCGKEFEVKQYRKNTAKFCSYKCIGKSREKENSK